jgi:hypothetical protein
VYIVGHDGLVMHFRHIVSEGVTEAGYGSCLGGGHQRSPDMLS